MIDAMNSLVAQEVAEVMPGTAWSDADLAELSDALDARLPDALVAWLTQFGTVFFEQPLIEVTFPSGSTHRTELGRLGYRPADMIKATRQFLEVRNTVTGDLVSAARIPPGFVVVGEAEGKRSRLLMDAVNVDNPSLLLWGVAYDPWEQGDNTQGLGRVADDLSQWLSALARAPYGP